MSSTEIRFGPAAAPRWFDSSLDRFAAYLDLITAAGATSIEFVALPEPGTEEERRVHIDIDQWSVFVGTAQDRGLTVNIHWPLPARFRLDGIAVEHLLALAEMINLVAPNQDWPPALIVHGVSTNRGQTGRTLGRLSQRLTHPVHFCIELRVPLSGGDTRWDRSVFTLAANLYPPIGMCWDIANQWLGTREIELPAEARAVVRHIHLHDSRPDLTLHAPLDHGAIDWRAALTGFLEPSPWQGCLTLEIRYRYASEVGDPWTVLDDSLRRANSFLNHGEN